MDREPTSENGFRKPFAAPPTVLRCSVPGGSSSRFCVAVPPDKGTAQIRAKIHPKLVPKPGSFRRFGTLIVERVSGQSNCRKSLGEAPPEACSNNELGFAVRLVPR